MVSLLKRRCKDYTERKKYGIKLEWFKPMDVETVKKYSKKITEK